MAVKIDAGGLLDCPACDSENLHQESVTTWFRDEDADLYSGYRVGRGGGRIVGPESNPSGRRDGLIVEFRCEGCDHRPKLAVVQHKGNTYVEWQD